MFNQEGFYSTTTATTTSTNTIFDRKNKEGEQEESDDEEFVAELRSLLTPSVGFLSREEANGVVSLLSCEDEGDDLGQEVSDDEAFKTSYSCLANEEESDDDIFANTGCGVESSDDDIFSRVYNFSRGNDHSRINHMTPSSKEEEQDEEVFVRSISNHHLLMPNAGADDDMIDDSSDDDDFNDAFGGGSNKKRRKKDGVTQTLQLPLQ